MDTSYELKKDEIFGLINDQNTLLITTKQKEYHVFNEIEIFEDSSNIKFDSLLSQLKHLPFHRINKFKLDRINPNNVYWIRFYIKNNGSAVETSQYIAQLPTQFPKVDFYLIDSSLGIQYQKTGKFVAFSEKNTIANLFWNFVKVDLTKRDQTLCLIRVEGSRKTTFLNSNIRIWQAEMFYHEVISEVSSDNLFIGLITLLLLYNGLLFFVVSRDRPHLYYALYLFSIILYFSYTSGIFNEEIATFLFDTHPEYFHFLKLSPYAITLSYFFFIRYFVETKTEFPKWDIGIQALTILGIVTMGIDTGVLINQEFDFYWSDRIASIYLLLAIIYLTIFLFPLSKSRKTKNYIIILGFTALSIGSIIYLATVLTGNQRLFYLKIGYLIELLIFSYGLAYDRRIRLINQQKLVVELNKNKIQKEKQEIEAKFLKELGAAKSQFYTNITHEFRTPITVILGLAEEIQTTSKKQIIAIKRNGKQLLQLINQMLALSKLESGREQLKMQQGDVVAFTKYMVESFHSFAATQDIKLEMNTAIDHLKMDYDPEKLQLILSNLIANAIKFTSAGGKVKVALKQIKQQLQIMISDTGEGILEEQLPYIFDRYYQADSIQENTGSGIGLTLVKEYVQMLEGKIELESKLGKGTTFYIQLPINQKVALSSILPSKISPIPVATNISSEVSNVSLSERPKILLIEDNKDVLHYLSLFLNNQYDLSFAYDGLEGAKKAIAEIPDLIVSDVMMPHKNGFELCEQIKKDEQTSHIPIILLTAKADFDSKIQGLEFGADVYLSKPFQKQELLVQIARLLEQQRTLQAHYSQLAMLPTDRYQVRKGEASFLYRVQSTLEANLDDENFDIAALCQSLHLSRMQLHRKLKELTGQTTSQYITNLRLKRSKDLLEQSELSIAEVAYQVGFKSQSHFSQVFTREIGQPPSTWRKEVED